MDRCREFDVRHPSDVARGIALHNHAAQNDMEGVITFASVRRTSVYSPVIPSLIPTRMSAFRGSGSYLCVPPFLDGVPPDGPRGIGGGAAVILCRAMSV